MLKSAKSRSKMMGLSLAASLPIWMCAACDPVSVLFDDSVAADIAIKPGESRVACAQASALAGAAFTPTAGQQVSISVNGPVGGSRPQILVFDAAGNVVANSGISPSGQNSSARFTPTTSGEHLLGVAECGQNSRGNYAIKVTQ